MTRRRRFRGGGDDLTVARRAHVRALGRLADLQIKLLQAQKAIQRADAALKRRDLRRAEKELRSARSAVGTVHAREWPGPVRIDKECEGANALSRERHVFKGMWRPLSPPDSPETLGCTAIVCNCLEELTDAQQVRQHWETGCFDVPEYETQTFDGSWMESTELEDL